MQKEKLSALMDGETLDNELLNELSRSSEMQKTWESYHLPTWASDFTGPYLYLPFLLQRHNFCGYAGSNSISWFRGCSVECGVFGLKNVRHSTAAS